MTAPARGFQPVDLPSVDYLDFILAKEGPHAVALVPSVKGGYCYLLLYWQPVTGQWVPRFEASSRDRVLSVLWDLECGHAGPLGWPNHPRFGLQLHRLMSGPDYPSDVSCLSAADADAIPHGLEWC